MASAKQIAWRKKFAKLYGKKKKKGSKSTKSTKSTKSKFERTGKKKDMVAGVDYFKDMKTLLGTNDKPKTKGWRKKNG
tara:strand:- start:243 stop:476 length:234 start_codon:yes stop_codon:yes gene_type:complete